MILRRPSSSSARNRARGFTLIELLTVIAIIAVLAAILFPVAATTREQARASDCMSKLHQIWVSANVYKADEDGFPPSLLGYAEVAPVRNQVCINTESTGVYYDGTNAPTVGGLPCLASASRVTTGFVYPEQIKDINVFKCPDNPNTNRALATIALFPPKPPNWTYPDGTPREWIGEKLSPICGTGPGGLTIDCFTSGPSAGKPKYHYLVDSYDIGPAVDANGNKILFNGVQVYFKHYSTDWTGVTGANDLPQQLKYRNPPDDRTILTFCTWHAAIAQTGSVPAVSMAGTAKKVNLKRTLDLGPNLYAQ